jgi:hypothetical protein
MKIQKLLLGLGFCLATSLHAQTFDLIRPLIDTGGTAAGYLIGNQFKSQNQYAPLIGAAAGSLITDFGYGIFKNKDDSAKLDYYISGRNYERWIRTQQGWYQSTLDPYTGRPPAFSGLNQMDVGIPNTAKTNSEGTPIDQVYTTPVKLQSGVYNGTPRTERIVDFPKLP